MVDTATEPPVSKARRKHPSLLFEWAGGSNRRWSLLLFLNVSLALHVACFYIFQVVYPPTVRQRAETTKVTYLDTTDPYVREIISRIEDRAVFFDGSLRQPIPGASLDELDDVVMAPSVASHEPVLRELPELQTRLELPRVFAADELFLPPLSRLLPDGKPAPRPKPFEGVYVYKPRLIPRGEIAGRKLAKIPDWSKELESISKAQGNHIRFLIEIDPAGRVTSCLPWAGVEEGFDAAIATKLEADLRYERSSSASRGWLDMHW